MAKSKRPSEIALFDAISSGNIQRVDNLLAIGVNPNAKNRQGWTPLMLALNFGQTEIVRLLLAKQADPHLRHITGLSPLMIAADYGNLETVRLLLGRNVQINAQTDRGRTALMFAAENGFDEIGRLLLENGADPHRKDGENQTAADWARRNGHLLLAELLAPTPALSTAQAGKIETVPIDIDRNLLAAVEKGHYHLAELLIDNSADVNTTNEAGESLLMIATRLSDAGLLQLLIERGADVNLTDRAGKTPLRLAEELNRPDLAAILRGEFRVADPVLYRMTDQHADTEFAEIYIENPADFSPEEMECLFGAVACWAESTGEMEIVSLTPTWHRATAEECTMTFEFIEIGEIAAKMG